jgi:hypothetical protein
MFDKNTRWLLGSVAAIIIIAIIATNYQNFTFSSFESLFNIKTYPKDTKSNNNLDDLNKALNIK